jgi:hypothetical protein
MDLIWVAREGKYFCGRGWTQKWWDSPSGKSVSNYSPEFAKMMGFDCSDSAFGYVTDRLQRIGSLCCGRYDNNLPDRLVALAQHGNILRLEPAR